MPYTRPYAGGFQDFPATTTPIDASALNTMDVGIKTANDQFQTVTTAQRATLTPSVGQAVWDSDLKQLMVFMNASGGNAWQPVGNRIVCASTTRPSSPFEGQEIYETDSQKTLVYSGSAWVETNDLDTTNSLSSSAQTRIDGIASYQNRFASFLRTAGDYTLNSTTWTSVDTTSDLTITASAGDVIETGINGLFGNQSTICFLDVVTRVSGSNVTSFSTRSAAPSGSTGGAYMPGCYSVASVYALISGKAHLTLASGDISSGNVTCRLQFRTTTAAVRSVYGSGSDLFYWYIRNLGPVTT